MILTVGFELYVFNTPYQQTNPLEEIIFDTASWVNKTVAIKGVLATVDQPNPTSYGLFIENQTTFFLNVRWNSSDVLMLQWNATVAVVHGVIREEEWTAVPNTTKEGVFYIEAENIYAS